MGAGKRWTVAVFVLTVVSILALSAQSSKLSFEVASVKRIQPRSGPPQPPSGSLPLRRNALRGDAFYRAGTVASFIQFAYRLTQGQVLGGSDWVRRDRFEIDARVLGEATNAETRLMVRSLLEERFKLVVREERREMPYSVLVIARSDGRLGPKLERCENPEEARLREPFDASSPVPAPVVIGPGGVPFTGRCVSIDVIAEVAARLLQTPVIDKTGLDGLWTYSMVYAQSQPLPAGPERDLADQAPLPSFSVALRDELGLELDRVRGAIDVLVIESIQQLIEN